MDTFGEPLPRWWLAITEDWCEAEDEDDWDDVIHDPRTAFCVAQMLRELVARIQSE